MKDSDTQETGKTNEMSPMIGPAYRLESAQHNAWRGIQWEPISLPKLMTLSCKYGEGKEVRVFRADYQRED